MAEARKETPAMDEKSTGEAASLSEALAQEIAPGAVDACAAVQKKQKKKKKQNGKQQTADIHSEPLPAAEADFMQFDGPRKKKKKKKKNVKARKSDSEGKGEAQVEFAMGLSFPANNATEIDTEEIKRAWLKEKLQLIKTAKRGLRDRGDPVERTRNAIAQATPDQLREAAKFFSGSPECLNKLHELAHQSGVSIDAQDT